MQLNIKVIIFHNEIYYNFLSLTLEEDGSLYIFLIKKDKYLEEHVFNSEKGSHIVKKLDKPSVMTRKISYHGSGQVNYPDAGKPKHIFCLLLAQKIQ